MERRRISLGHAIALGALLLFGITPTVAHAQINDSHRAAARALATEGLRAIEQGRWADGLDRFERAEALIHATPHLLYIARASVKLGKLVRANEAYMKIIREELAPRSPKAFVEARRAAISEEAALAPRLPKLRIVVKGERARDATVTIDGTALPRALVGVAQPADPGAHTLRASAPGWTSDEVTATLAEGATETVTLELNHREVTAAAPAQTPAEPERLPNRGVSPLAWGAFGIGALGLGAGTYFLIQNRGKREDANALCTPRCPVEKRPEVEALDAEADDAVTFSWIGYGVGAAGVIAGTTLLFLRGSSSSKVGGAGITPWVGAASAGIAGRF